MDLLHKFIHFFYNPPIGDVAPLQLDSWLMPSVAMAIITSLLVRPPKNYWAKTTILLGSLGGCLVLYALFLMGQGQLTESGSARIMVSGIIICAAAGWLARSKDDPYGDGGWGGGDDGDDPEDDPKLPLSGGGIDWQQFDRHRSEWESGSYQQV